MSQAGNEAELLRYDNNNGYESPMGNEQSYTANLVDNIIAHEEKSGDEACRYC